MQSTLPGEITDLIYRNVSPSINIQRGQVSSNNPEDTGAVSGAVGLPYRMGARRIEYVPLLPCDVRLGYWRSVGESYNTFAVESAIDELALLKRFAFDENQTTALPLCFSAHFFRKPRHTFQNAL